MCIRPGSICLETKFQRIIKRRHIGSPEQTKGLGVIQELQTDTFVTLPVQGRFVVESFNSFKTVNNRTFRLLIIEIVFSQISIRTGAVVVIKQVHRETVYAYTHVIFPLICSLRRCQPPALLPNVVHNTHRTGIMCTGRIGKVRFQTEYTDRPCSRFETVFKGRHIHAVNFQRGTVFFQAQEIKTVILTRISGG